MIEALEDSTREEKIKTKNCYTKTKGNEVREHRLEFERKGFG